MTSRPIDWDKFNEMKEKSDSTISDFKRMDEIRSILNKDDEEKKRLREELNNLIDKYHQSYSSKPNPYLPESYGVLTVVTLTDSTDSHILSVDDENIKLQYYYNYGQSSKTIDIPIKNLREEGYYHYTEHSDDLYIVDDIKDPLKVYEIIEWRLRYEMSQVLRDTKWRKESIAEYEQKLQKSLKDLEQFKQVPDNKITRIFNDISFGVTHLEVDEILKVLPRTIELYKEKSE